MNKIFTTEKELGIYPTLDGIIHHESDIYIKDEKTGNVLKGNTETRLTHTYILTFVRKRGVLTQAGGPKVASANCPNCGAPTKVALAGKCEYCGSLIKIEDHGWVLSNLERM